MLIMAFLYCTVLGIAIKLFFFITTLLEDFKLLCFIFRRSFLDAAYSFLHPVLGLRWCGTSRSVTCNYEKAVKGSRGCADLSDFLILYDVNYPFFFYFMFIVRVGCCIHYVETPSVSKTYFFCFIYLYCFVAQICGFYYYYIPQTFNFDSVHSISLYYCNFM